MFQSSGGASVTGDFNYKKGPVGLNGYRMLPRVIPGSLTQSFGAEIVS